jgi:hypothetical protein
MVLDDVATGAEQRARRHDMVAGSNRRHHRRGHRSHAGRRRAAGLGAFEGGHAGLQHRRRRITQPAVLEARIGVQEAAFGLCRIVVDMALRQVERLGGLAELRTLDAVMDEAGLGVQLGCGFVR